MNYDYGKEENWLRYGSYTPPNLDISKIKDVPIALFVGKQDDLSTPEVGQWTKNKVKDNIVYYNEMDNHDHFSSAVAKDMSFMNDVIELLDGFNLP